MCRAGLRHCKPTEAQKRAAAERRKKNRHAHKAVIEALRKDGKDDIADQAIALSPLKLKEFLEVRNLTEISGFNDLPDRTQKRLSPSVLENAKETITYGGYGFDDDVVYTDEEFDEIQPKIRDGVIRDLGSISRSEGENIILSYENIHVTDHVLAQARWLDISGDQCERHDEWLNISREVCRGDDFMEKEDLIARISEISNNPANKRSFAYSEMMGASSEGSPFNESHIDDINKHFLNNDIDKITYHPIGNNTYALMYKSDNESFMSIAHIDNQDNIVISGDFLELDVKSIPSEFPYIDGALDEVGNREQTNQLVFKMYAGFVLSKQTYKLFTTINNSSAYEDTPEMETLAEELHAAANYYDGEYLPSYYKGYIPFKKTVDDFRLFSAGMQVDKENMIDVPKDTTNTFFKNVEVKEIDDFKESERFYESMSNEVRINVRGYVSNDYIEHIKASKGIPVSMDYSGYNSILEKGIMKTSEEIKIFESNNKEPRYLRRTVMPPYGMNIQSFSDSMPIGSKLHTTRLTSTTAAYNSNFKGNYRDNVIFHYHTKNGAAVTKVGFKDEREVIISANDEFVVVGNEIENDHLHIYLMDEDLLDDGKGDA